MQYRFVRLCLSALVLCCAIKASYVSFAYTTYQATEGSLKLYFGEHGKIVKSETITEIDKLLTVKVTFENLSDLPMAIKLHFRTIETIEFSGAEPTEPDSVSQSLEIPAKNTKTTEVKIVARPGTYIAHYPVHLDVEFTANGETKKTNIVLIVETKLPIAGTSQNPTLGQEITDTKKLTLNIFSGEKPSVLTSEEKQKLFAENLAAIKSGQSESDKTKIFKLNNELIGAVTFGYNGFADGVIGVGNTEKQVQFDGLRVFCKNQPLGFKPTSINSGSWISKNVQNPDSPPKPQTKNVQKQQNAFGENQWAQDVEINGQRETLFFTMAKNGEALQFSIDSSSADLIDRIEFGTATCHANRVYYGHGYCIEEPEAFTASAGGHNLSTSHVGMDFENGISILQASSFPPDSFIVDPDTKKYTLSVH
ncbi:MAG: hypothetical protein LBF88_06470, partial [Planctomycetaceae bacterium]|nr:hypothetical protein [Planctomycetaceae bacterium]